MELQQKVRTTGKLSSGAFLFMFTFFFALNGNTQIFNASYSQISMGGAGVTITAKVGSGLSVNDIVLYQNVITISGQQIDAIVRTQELSNVSTFTTYDYTGTTNAANNLPSFFSPQFSFGSGGGYAVFKIQFILGGSYNNSTNTGTLVTLQNIRLNTYDLDGNGSSGTNQYAEFGGFSSYELGSPTNLSMTYNSTLGLTKFRTSLSTNTIDVTDVKNRVRVTYDYLSEFVTKLGSGGSGAAYFFLDFSAGSTFTTAVSYTAPVLDLNTVTSGLDNSAVIIAPSSAFFTYGGANITFSGSTLDNLKLSFASSQIYDGANELLVFNGASSGGPIPLNFTNGQVFSNIQIGGVTYAVTATVSGGVSTLTFVKSDGSGMTLAQDEALLDAFVYSNTSSNATIATRVFTVTTLAGSFETAAAKFYLTISSSLPTEMISFNADCNEEEVQLEWTMAGENSIFSYTLEKSLDGLEWSIADVIEDIGTSAEMRTYHATDELSNQGSSTYYRIVQEDLDGNKKTYNPISIHCNAKNFNVNVYPNPIQGDFYIELYTADSQLTTFHLFDATGVAKMSWQQQIEKGANVILVSGNDLVNGLYYLSIEHFSSPKPLMVIK